METNLTEELILDDLMTSFQHFFESKVYESTPIKRGWLNLKWKISTDSGQFLLKQYNKERFALYDPDELTFAFTQQVRLRHQGLACPNLLSHDGRFLLESGNGERFIVMEFCQGTLIPPGKATVQQIYDLGRTTGKMHRLLNDGTLGSKDRPQFIPPSREERLAHWESVWKKTKESGKNHLLAAIELQWKATEAFQVELLKSLAPGWAHRDLWVDNILFDQNRVSAIVDFDRLKFDYPQLDVGRALLSCALDDDLDVSLASAFMEGYCEERPVMNGYAAHSLQLLWYLESTWWINPNMDQHSIPPARFAKEMTWLADNLKNLADLLEGI